MGLVMGPRVERCLNFENYTAEPVRDWWESLAVEERQREIPNLSAAAV
jgi:hypothetical protein